jgi:hypothetical protein
MDHYLQQQLIHTVGYFLAHRVVEGQLKVDALLGYVIVVNVLYSWVAVYMDR